MSRAASIQKLKSLYERHRSRMTPQQRKAAVQMLQLAQAGKLTQAEAMRRSSALLAKEGLTPEQAWRRLRWTPYYRHVKAVLSD